MSGLDTCVCRVLLFGHEASLLSSRTWLLAKLACQCTAVSSLADFRRTVLEGDLRLVILCQTLTNEEGLSASVFASEYLHDVQMLMMFSRHFGFEPVQDYVLLDASAGPDAFMQTTKRMLAQASLRQRQTLPRRPSSAVPR